MTEQTHNDSTFFNRLSKRVQGKEESFIVPPRTAQEEQTKQIHKVYEAEIEELKQSLRYIEISLARAKEENETYNNKVLEQQTDIEKGYSNLAKQLKINQQQARQIEDLQRKIEAYNSNQRDLQEKNRFKASTYMTEINSREEELGKIRAQLLNNQDEMKLLTVSREQYRQQYEKSAAQLHDRERELDKLRGKVLDQNRIMDSMVIAQKNLSDTVDQGEAMERVREDVEKAERIARTTNKSSFMILGDKQPKLMSEEHLSSGQRSSKDPFRGTGDVNYLMEDSLPTEFFPLIQQYRDKLVRAKTPQSNSLLLDDFFGEIHRMMKDLQLRELARVRNEHSVEIMKLRKTLENKLKHEGVYQRPKDLKAKENFHAFKASEKFVENEIERQRRALVEENEILKKRMRGLETLVKSGSSERSKFMEGASWIAKKAHLEIEKHVVKMHSLLGEFQRKAQECVIDTSIMEVDGKQVAKVNKWMGEAVEKEIGEVGEKIESLFENVNFHLKEATANFHKYS